MEVYQSTPCSPSFRQTTANGVTTESQPWRDPLSCSERIQSLEDGELHDQFQMPVLCSRNYADNANSLTSVCDKEMGENKLTGKR